MAAEGFHAGKNDVSSYAPLVKVKNRCNNGEYLYQALGFVMKCKDGAMEIQRPTRNWLGG